MSDSLLTVDAKNLLCPMPIIRLQQAIASISVNTKIRLLATDPGTKADVQAWTRVHGHTLLSQRQEIQQEQTVYVFDIATGSLENA